MAQRLNTDVSNRGVDKIERKSLIKVLQNLPTDTTNFVEYETKYKIEGNYDDTTLKLIIPYNNAHNFFKKYLFGDLLSGVVLALNRKTRSAGYYRPSGYLIEDSIIVPEININPKMLFLSPEEVMSILVHEQCHHFQYLHGNPGRGKYHNREFARLMEYIGLMCSATGLPGGKKTGESMSHYIIPGGRFEQACSAMPEEYMIPFKTLYDSALLQDRTNGKISESTYDKNKIKFMCPKCYCAAWGKPTLHISCNNCNNTMLRQT
jgi:hypothetical protein